VGTKELQALIEVLQEQVVKGREGYVLGTWTIHYDKSRAAFTFDKCEDGVYCEERADWRLGGPRYAVAAKGEARHEEARAEDADRHHVHEV